MGLNLCSKILGAAAMFAVAVTMPAAGYAQTLGDPTAGTYYGDGNPTGNWTMITAPSGIELGLRAVYRFGPAITADSVGNYTVDTGVDTNPCSGLSCGLWNYNFSIDMLNSGYNLSDLVANLTITSGQGLTTTFNVLTITDNDTDGGSTTRVQNSENLAFPIVGLAGYDPWAGDSYTFKLTVFAEDMSLVVASASMVVNAVPEPASMALLGAGLVGLGLIRRRRRA